MANNGNKIWIEPNNAIRLLGDIKVVLGHNSNDLGTLCLSDKINKWSKNKPVRSVNLSPLSSIYRYNLNWGIFVSQSDNPEIFGSMLKSDGSLWKYIKPDSRFRVRDFDGYVHNSHNPSVIQINEGPFSRSNPYIRIKTTSPGDIMELCSYSPLREIKTLMILNWGFLIGGYNQEGVFIPSAYYPVTGRDSDSGNAIRVDLEMISINGGADGPNYQIDASSWPDGDTFMMACFTTWDPIRAAIYPLDHYKQEWMGSAWWAMDTIVKATVKEPVPTIVEVIPEQYGRWESSYSWTIGLRIRLKCNIALANTITVSGEYLLVDQNGVDYYFDNGKVTFTATLSAGATNSLSDYKEVVIEKVLQENNACWITVNITSSNIPGDVRTDKIRYNWLTDNNE